MNTLFYPIVVPILAGLLCLCIPKKIKGLRETLTLLCTLAAFGWIIRIFAQKPLYFSLNGIQYLRLDNLSGFVLLAVGLFGMLISLFSIPFMKNCESPGLYYGGILMTLGAAVGAVLANHLILLLIFWGFLGATLYLLVLTGGADSAAAAKKSLIIVGGSDAIMLLGILLVNSLTSTYEINKAMVPLDTWIGILAFLCLLIGGMAKAGAMPLHTWIPDVSLKAPLTITAYLPAALDKLLGIYLIGRISLNLFQMSAGVNMVMLVVGAITIIAAVMMALIQHDLRTLLAYHAVSQVGYMMLGIGTGNPLGIAGGLFHMLNHSIYKACLFLAGGSVQFRTKATDLNQMGGLGRLMPVTFISFLIAAFAISGIPPFNGFVSKWMVYQGLIELGKSGDKLWVLWLTAAMFGSGLTLASFMKLTHTIFLGRPSDAIAKAEIKESPFTMTIPLVVLAGLCVLFGVFAIGIPVKHFLIPAVGQFKFTGIWSPGLATVLVLVGAGIGIIIYLFGKLGNYREAESFIGGESLPSDERISGTGFYETVRQMRFFEWIYQKASSGLFDCYQLGARLLKSPIQFLKNVHNGLLTTYLLWTIVGLGILLIILMGK